MIRHFKLHLNAKKKGGNWDVTNGILFVVDWPVVFHFYLAYI